MPVVYTQFQPTAPLEVDEAEAKALRAQGLLVDPPKNTRTPAPAAAAPAPATPDAEGADTKGSKG